MHNEAWVIAEPSRREYNPECLRWEKSPIAQPDDGEVLVKTLLISLDPTSRNWLKLEPSSSYLPLAIGSVMIGQAIGIVEESRSADFAPGDLVKGMWGWERYSVAQPMLIERFTRRSHIPLEAHLSIFSHVGRAAAIGLFEIGQARPTDVVVVSGAAGATGSIAAQMAKAQGNRVIGIAGGPKKCRLLINEFGLDGAIDYKHEDVVGALSQLCPEGIDVYFDNVGGPILDSVLSNMAVGCRVAVCGAMSQYDLADPGQAYGCKNLPQVLFRRAHIQGFVVPDFSSRMGEFDAILKHFYERGKIQHRAHIVEGLELAPKALKHVFNGSNDGKLMVRVACI
jgi:NADPH-dependent curcumin reductase CurA